LPNPKIEVVKSVTRVLDTNGDGLFGSAGDIIEYGFFVTNTGSEPLTDVMISDVNANISGGPIGLAAGASDTTTFTGTHTVITVEFAAGYIENSAKVTGVPTDETGTPLRGPGGSPLLVEDISDAGTDAEGNEIPEPTTTETPPNGPSGSQPPDGDPTNDPTVLRVPTNPMPKILLVKSIDVVSDSNEDLVLGAADDVVTYRFDVTNIGNTDLENVVVNDPLLGGEVANIAKLAQDDTVSVFGNYTIVEADEINGFVENTADAKGSSINAVGSPILVDGVQPSATDISDAGTEPDGTDITDPSGEETPDGSGVTDSDPTNDPTVVNVPYRPSDLLVSGTVFLDGNGDGELGNGDVTSAGAGYVAVLRDLDGNEVARATTGAAGTYSLTGFRLNEAGYEVEFLNPAGVAIGKSEEFVLTKANPVRTNVDQPIDPAGVVYNSTTGDPIAGVTMQLTDENGTPLPDVCLGAGQQNQITGADGAYNFDINVGAATACPAGQTEYQIGIINAPSIFEPGVSTVIPPEAGSLEVTSCTLDAVPGGSCQLSSSLTAPDPAAPTPYYFSFSIESGDPDVINNHIPLDLLDTVVPTGLNITKVVSNSATTVVLGDAVPYTVTVTNPGATAVGPISVVDTLPRGISFVPGSARIDGVATIARTAGLQVRFEGLTLAPTSTVTITMMTRVNPTAPVGDLTNRAVVVDSATGERLSNVATATVTRIPEHVFDCSDVIGKVFDDRNGNGYQDGPNTDGIGSQNYATKSRASPEVNNVEPGLPGVRVVTIDGTVITTDEHGRFHVPCAALPKKTGTNFILKLDPRSLPSGYRVTTENPRVVRITAGKFAKLNFGASISNVIRIDLNKSAFVSGTKPKAKFINAVRNMVKKMDATPSVIRLTYVYSDGASEKVARARIKAVERVIRKEWSRVGKYKLNIERTVKRRPKGVK